MAIEQGQVQGTEFSKNGKPKIKIAGNWYFAGRCDISAIKQGQTIEFEWNEFGEPRNGKRPRGLQNWALVTTNGHAEQSYQQHCDVPASALDDQDRPAISNWVAHAIAAGHIKSPTDIKAWALASQEALQALKVAKPAPRPPQKLPTDYEPDLPPQFTGEQPPSEEPTQRRSTW